MDLKQRLTLGSFWIAILASTSLTEQFKLTSSPSVVGTVGKDVILPCQISLGRQPQGMEVQWQKNGDVYIDIYQFKALSGLETFGPGYQPRTALAKEGLPHGNVSLKVKNVQVADQGSYRCIVKSTGWIDSTRTVLHVSGMGMVSIEILGPEGEGIKLACRSLGWFPRPELQWLTKGNQSHPFELEQDHRQLFSVFSSITVLRGTREVTCLVHEKDHLQMEQKASIYLSRDIFPKTSPWLPAFWVVILLSFLVLGLTGYYIYKEKQKNSMKKHTEEEENMIKECLKKTFESDIKELYGRLERAHIELDFRKAHSYLVPVHLDPNCKHPELAVSADCSEVQHDPASSEAAPVTGAPITMGRESTSSKAATMARSLIAVGREACGEGKQYWQVWVGDNPHWEIGVLTEAARAKLEKQKFKAPPKKGCWSLRKSDGKYHPEEADHEISNHSIKPQIVGVFLDWEEHIVTFYSVNNMLTIMKIPVETSEKLYPFFSPGNSELGDKVKPLSICHNSDWDFTSQLVSERSLIYSSCSKIAQSRITENLQAKKQCSVLNHDLHYPKASQSEEEEGRRQRKEEGEETLSYIPILTRSVNAVYNLFSSFYPR